MKINKTLTTWVWVGSLVLGLGKTTSSYALAGIIGGNVPVAIAGAGVMGGGGLMILHAQNVYRGERLGFWRSLELLGGTVFWFFGGLLLDGENHNIQFNIITEKDREQILRSLNEKESKEYWITADQVATYNHEIEEANAIKDQIAIDLTNQEAKEIASKVLRTDKINQSMELWSHYDSRISRDTVQVIHTLAYVRMIKPTIKNY